MRAKETIMKINSTRVSTNTIIRIGGFFIAIGIAVGMSGWSLYGFAMLMGFPKLLAVVSFIAYDIAAIVLGSLAIEYAKSEHSGFNTRFFTYMFIALSAAFNIYHAYLLHLSIMGMAFYGLPSISAGILFEQILAFENKASLAKRGRILTPMPVVSKFMMIVHPLKTFRGYDRLAISRFDETFGAISCDTDATETSLNAIVAKHYANGATTVTKLLPLVRKTKGDEITKQQVSKALSYVKKSMVY